MAVKIYTKTGDLGQTSLVDGKRVHKSHERLEAYGTVDELNAHIGLARALLMNTQNMANLVDFAKHTDILLAAIQNCLFTLGSQLACGDEKMRAKLPMINDEQIEYLEKNIDSLESGLPPLREFVLPAGSATAAALHVARTVCRRAERHTFSLIKKKAKVPELIPKYLNRLSDFLFVLARAANQQQGHGDQPWKKP